MHTRTHAPTQEAKARAEEEARLEKERARLEKERQELADAVAQLDALAQVCVRVCVRV